MHKKTLWKAVEDATYVHAGNWISGKPTTFCGASRDQERTYYWQEADCPACRKALGYTVSSLET